ncbi:MAG: flagellar filament capping protein FliD [Vicinamibacterales bacterium]
MGSGITFSGFNSIDFNVVLNAVMQQESRPLTSLQSRQSALQSRVTSFTTLQTRVSALESAAKALSTAGTATAFKATSSDPLAVGVSAGSSAVAGRYDIVVNELARAQVTASASTAPDADTTAIATGGTITIGAEIITVSSSVTLKQLSDAINANANAPARASVVQSGAASFKLVLTSKSTGAANAFTIANGLTGGAGLGFTDTDADLVSGDSAADNAVQATDAQALINNIVVSSASNTLDAAVPGTTITLYKKDPAATIVVDVTEDPSALKAKLQTFVSTFNDLVKFTTDQGLSAGRGDQGSIGRDPLLRQLRNSLRGALGAPYATGGPYSYLAQVGVQATRAGTLELNATTFAEATKNGGADAGKLLAGTDVTPGALASIKTLLTQYTQTSGILKGVQEQLTSQISRLGSQIISMQDRLAIRRAGLQQEYSAADAAMSRLKSQSGSLSSFGQSL